MSADVRRLKRALLEERKARLLAEAQCVAVVIATHDALLEVADSVLDLETSFSPVSAEVH